MHDINMFDRVDALSLDGFEGSGADWLDEYKKYINDGETIIASPHKVYGPSTNDLTLQLRKRRVDKVILAGMSANLCVEAHMRHAARRRIRGCRGEGCDSRGPAPRTGRMATPLRSPTSRTLPTR